jgi:hypothetical protein
MNYFKRVAYSLAILTMVGVLECWSIGLLNGQLDVLTIFHPPCVLPIRLYSPQAVKGGKVLSMILGSFDCLVSASSIS